MKRAALLLAAAALLGAAGASLYVLTSQGVPPRTLGPYIEQRSLNHNPTIETIGRTANAWLMHMDRGPLATRAEGAWTVGAKPSGARPMGTLTVTGAVGSVRQLQRAIGAANPGDVITLLPGTYRVTGSGLKTNRAGREGAPITLRGSAGVVIESTARAAMTIDGPWWRIEHLTVKGVCADDTVCEHAFHVTGGASHFTATNNTISDFNAHVKINGSGGRFPDHGLLESNTLNNSRARKTRNPVTPIDLVGASNWIIRHNLISDFLKDGGDRISYGAFAKGAGTDNLFERNIVICEWRLQRAPGQRVGLSLGGGGTGPQFCRDRRCIVEQERSILRDNLIASCSDDGVYLNNAAASRLEHNTLVDTGGVTVRFAGSSAVLSGNLVDGAIRARDGGALDADDNLETAIAARYLGRHPWRSVFRKAEALDLRWRDEEPGRRSVPATNAIDLCGTTRPAAPVYGAFENFSACLGSP